jgi:hypothetical protein
MEWYTGIGQVKGDFGIIMFEPGAELGSIGFTFDSVKHHLIASFRWHCGENE